MGHRPSFPFHIIKLLCLLCILVPSSAAAVSAATEVAASQPANPQIRPTNALTKNETSVKENAWLSALALVDLAQARGPDDPPLAVDATLLPCALMGDFNLDGQISADDLELLVENWHKLNIPDFALMDMDHSLRIDVADMILLQANLGAPCTGVPPVPGGGLERLNWHRAQAGVPAVTEDAAMTSAARLHAHYMVLNWGEYCHCETSGHPGYSTAGDQSARNSNLYWGMSSIENAIDGWIAGIYHRLGMTRPSLKQTGLAFESDGTWHSGTVLNVLQGVDWSSSANYPAAYPGNNQVNVPLRHALNEAPNPLASCPGYTTPVGFPITLQFQQGQVVTISSVQFTDALGAAVEFCRKGPSGDSYMQNSLGLIPRYPLTALTRYTVSVSGTYQGASFTRTWSFVTAASTSTPDLKNVPAPELPPDSQPDIW